MEYEIVISDTCLEEMEENKTILISHMYYSGKNYLDGGLL